MNEEPIKEILMTGNHDLSVHDLARANIDVWAFMRELEKRIAAIEAHKNSLEKKRYGMVDANGRIREIELRGDDETGSHIASDFEKRIATLEQKIPRVPTVEWGLDLEQRVEDLENKLDAK